MSTSAVYISSSFGKTVGRSVLICNIMNAQLVILQRDKKDCRIRTY